MGSDVLDRIRIVNLDISCIIGISEWEHDAPQTILANLTLYADLRPAAQADDLSLTVDYRTVVQGIRREVIRLKFGLLEALAEHVADHCLQYAPVQRVDVSLRKPAALRHAEAACAEITRVKPPSPST